MKGKKVYIDADGNSLPYPALINTVLMLAGGIETLRLRFWSRKPRHAAEKTLRDILTVSKDTVYGKEHHFDVILSATSADSLFRLYRHYVPANDSFETLRPYVERHKNGEQDVLFPGKPDMYATTSGTTSEPKWVPMTHKYLKDVYGKMSHIWTWNFVKHRSRIFGGHIFPIVGKEVEGYAPDGTLYGSVSGVLVRDIPGIIKKHYTAPACVMAIEDYTARNYTLMLMALQHRDVTLWATANPSTMLELMRTVEEHIDELILDIDAGTISDRYQISEEIRKELQPWIKPRPERAKELMELRNQGKMQPKYYWPLLQYLSTWKCGNTRIYMDKYMDQFDWDQTYYQELGYIATECRFGFSLDDTNESVLFPHFHYYEFVEENELDKAHKHFLQIDELEVGKRYCAYVTTYSGIFRYNMNDLVEVAEPLYGNTPRVHMIGKVNGIVSLTGEKLYEPQFIQAVHEAEEETGIKTKFFVGFADVEESLYHFYFEFDDEQRKARLLEQVAATKDQKEAKHLQKLADGLVTQAEADAFAKVVDEHLQKINVEYECKRQSFRLHEPKAHILLSNAYSRFKSACLKDGFRDGQFKFNLLMQDERRRDKFKLIERTLDAQDRLGDNLFQLAERMEERHNERQERREVRREQRQERREQRREARQARKNK
ncbi:MAG: GH3 auxin-responsive promoter family protein [Paludibacteraceae bacterium]|nr:GH3 auxin-responsive promoter family protein [Paludibacteraceae bacterium]